MAHFAVAHLAVGQTHIQPGGGQLRVGEFLEELVQTGRVGGQNGVAGGAAAVGHPEAIHNN